MPTKVAKKVVAKKKSKISSATVTDAQKASIKKVAMPAVGQPLIGCHVSIAGGLENAPARAALLECETFQIFSRSPHGGSVAPITAEVAAAFKSSMAQAGIETCVIHAPYILNFGSAKPSTFHGSINIVRTDLERGTQLGAKYVMFHPGSFKDLGEKDGMKQAHEGLKKVLDDYTGTTQLLIEISAGAGSVIGDTFEEIAELMKPIKSHKGFGGICFDTQHAFGSGYDLRDAASVKKTFAAFDKIIGLKYLRMCHVNDSKVEFGSHRDRHEHIGDGNIGKNGFIAILDFLKQKKLTIPLILETDHDKVESDIKLLKALRAKALK
ncbi:MAG TPA: deoxyribonuclease IV [Patescibacteria group bacterium]|jgi:deoxyribonuclease-4|nr:deoxyribonuclease IV [Patescibacteria group bacterium]